MEIIEMWAISAGSCFDAWRSDCRVCHYVYYLLMMGEGGQELWSVTVLLCLFFLYTL
ncbi:MAG: hypothetical protein AAFR77_13735 [Cyanobacteria bacterium J06631_2]